LLKLPIIGWSEALRGRGNAKKAAYIWLIYAGGKRGSNGIYASELIANLVGKAVAITVATRLLNHTQPQQ